MTLVHGNMTHAQPTTNITQFLAINTYEACVGNILTCWCTNTIFRCHAASCTCFTRTWKTLPVSSMTLCLNSPVMSYMRIVGYDASKIVSSPSSVPLVEVFDHTSRKRWLIVVLDLCVDQPKKMLH